jgi:hypothetical protein
MPAPADRERHYVEKRPDGAYAVEADFDARLPVGATLTGGTVRAFRDDVEVAATTLMDLPPQLGTGARKLILRLKATPVEATPAVLGTYRLEVLGVSSQAPFMEPLLIFLLVRPQSAT